MYHRAAIRILSALDDPDRHTKHRNEGMMRYFALMTVLTAFGTSTPAFADSYETYDSNDAVSYATSNYNTSYGGGGNPFHDYDYLAGGNCTNFISQAIIGGMIESNNMTTVYNSRYSFDIDAGGGYYQWYWRSDADRGPAFTGADKLYEYAENNSSSYKGLHFDYVTHDTLTYFMDYWLVEKGDIVFADWDHDGHIDHSMIVTGIQTWRPGYNEIRLTYQGTTGVVGKTNIGLGDINQDYNYEALFYVYRPVDYSPTGL